MQGMIVHHAQAVEMTAMIRVAHAEQRPAFTGGTHQQLAVGRNQVHEALAGGPGRTDSEGDAENAGHGYVR